MKPQFWVLCIVVLCCSLLARVQDFEAGLAAYERGDYQVALNELAPLAEQGDAQAQYRIGQMHRYGKGVPRDAQKALRLFRAAAISGHTDSQQALGMILLLGLGVPADESEAFKWLSLAAEHHPSRQYLLGELYENTEHYAEAANWYRKAAEKGKTTTSLAQYALGGLYERGRGVPQDYTQAAEWYRLAAEHGLREAQLILGRMHWEGDVVPQDFAKASHFFQEAAKGYRKWAEVGNPEDQFVLGTMYERGEIWEVDYREAAKWYRRAADRGHAQAQYRLGLIYTKGASEGGAPKDFAEAQKWFRKASEQGNSRAEIELGVLYEEGNGVPQDHAEAARWYRKAAEKGNALAQVLLANLYREGRGLPQSLVDAHMWYNLAAAAGVSLAAEYRDLVDKRMTPDQITRAQELARNWHARSETVTESPKRHTLGSIDFGLRLAGSGTGFVVGPPGFVVTNEHVVEGCRSVRTRIAGRPRTLATVTADESNDLALLKLAGESNRPTATFRAGRGPRVGETVVTVGYPLSGLLADSPTVTTGVLSTLAGPGNDARLMQITAPIQQGSSGSPLLDASGNVVGIVVSKLDALRVASLTGDVPQNVNFAIKASVVRAFLEANGVEFRTTASTAGRDTPALADQARKYTIPLECWK